MVLIWKTTRVYIPHVVACASKLVPCYPNRIPNTSISRDCLECGSVRLAPKRPRTLSVRSFRSIVCYARQRPGSFDGAIYIFQWIPWDALRKSAEWQVSQRSNTCFSGCPGICQLGSTLKSSIPDHRLDTAIWRFTAAQHFADFQRQLPQPRRITSTSHAPQTQRRECCRSLALVSRLTVITTQRSVVL